METRADTLLRLLEVVGYDGPEMRIQNGPRGSVPEGTQT
jgi:hypothetical protein